MRYFQVLDYHNILSTILPGRSYQIFIFGWYTSDIKSYLSYLVIGSFRDIILYDC